MSVGKVPGRATGWREEKTAFHIQKGCVIAEATGAGKPTQAQQVQRTAAGRLTVSAQFRVQRRLSESPA